MTEVDSTRCARHPDVETNLRCGKCGTPICPRCMIQSPVGARCPDCAKLTKSPTYRVSSSYYLRATGAALGTALVIGVGWGIVQNYLRGFFFILGIVLGYGLGIAMSEAISRAVNRKRGTGLAIIGVLGVILCYGITWLVTYLWTGYVLSLGVYQLLFSILTVVFGIYIAASRLR